MTNGGASHTGVTGIKKARSLQATIKARVGSFFEARFDEKKRQAERHRSEPILESQVSAMLTPSTHRASEPILSHTEEINPDSNLLQLIQQAVTCPIHKEILLGLREEPAADTISLMQKILDRPGEYGLEPHRYTLRRLLIRLSRESHILPSSLFLSGVVCKDRDAFGGGAFADIFQAKYNGKMVALKRLRVFQISTNEQKKEHVSNFFREALMWRQLNHPHILPFIGVDRLTFPGHLCMVSPFLQSGNVIQCIQYFLQIKADVPREPWVRGFVQRWYTNVDMILFCKLLEIAKGLAYLHEEQIVHGDLRGANILIDEDLHVRLADFGLAVLADASTSSGISTRSGGAARWCSPEVLKGEPSSLESDIYAFGCVCVELYTLNYPFPEFNDAQAVAKILNGVRPRCPSPDTGIQPYIWFLARRCWSITSCRPDISAVIHALADHRNAPSSPSRSPSSSPRRPDRHSHRTIRNSLSNADLVELAELANLSESDSHSFTVLSSPSTAAGTSPFLSISEYSPMSLEFINHSSPDRLSDSPSAVAHMHGYSHSPPPFSPNSFISDLPPGFELSTLSPRSSLETDDMNAYSPVVL
ncbi:unnamed protein product [Somion occarium]|uniref:Protein kinase domain-containing protein n=1 Tax=Somion occarium TaxID=3059160 RepID=A0ABP1DR72_9APHY